MGARDDELHYWPPFVHRDQAEDLYKASVAIGERYAVCRMWCTQRLHCKRNVRPFGGRCIAMLTNRGKNHADCERLIRRRVTQPLWLRRPCQHYMPR